MLKHEQNMIEFVIYRITNIRNNRIYIGSTGDFITRKAEHLGQLRQGKHCNTRLQRDFNEFKEHSFVFEVVADGFRNRQSMLMKEYEWILRTKEYSYNINRQCPVRGSSKRKLKEKAKKASKSVWKNGKESKYMRNPSADKTPTTYYPDRKKIKNNLIFCNK